jgi:1-acyl-sn-glycerol-3-phosphate acyltransferase
MAPQGHVSPDVCHFKRGAFLIAIRAGVPVVPMGVQGGADILPAHSLRMRPGVLRYRIGSPIPTVGYIEADAPALAQRVQDEVARLVGTTGSVTTGPQAGAA